MMDPLVRRRDAAQATLDRFRDKPFRWGTRDCSRMIAHHLRLVGYRVKLPPSGSYGTLLGATKALRAAGFAKVGEALDALGLARVAPAATIVGDIIEWPRKNELAALGIALGGGRMLAYHPDAVGATVLQPLDYVAAWRVEPV